MTEGEKIMATDEMLMDAVAKFTDADVDAFRREWNARGVQAETQEKQKIFDEALKKTSSKNLILGGISARVLMKYYSLSGELKERQVVLRRIFKNKSEIFIDAFCLDINEPRLIKLKNVLQVVDINTKTLYANPENFFEDVLGIDLKEKEKTHLEASSLSKGELKTAINLTRYEITALLFIAGVDNQRDDEELKTIVDYVHTRCPNLTFNDKDLMDYLHLYYPDSQSFYFALERILGQEGWIVKMFIEKLKSLIVADGKVHEKEKLFFADFLAVLEEEGFILNFKKR